MRFLQVLVMTGLMMFTNAQAGKVTWGSDGKAHIETSSEPLEGCSQGGLDELTKENNSSDC